MSLVLCATSRHTKVTTWVKASQCLTTRLTWAVTRGLTSSKNADEFHIYFALKKSPLVSVSPRSKGFLLRWGAPTAGSQAGCGLGWLSREVSTALPGFQPGAGVDVPI